MVSKGMLLWKKCARNHRCIPEEREKRARVLRTLSRKRGLVLREGLALQAKHGDHRRLGRLHQDKAEGRKPFTVSGRWDVMHVNPTYAGAHYCGWRISIESPLRKPQTSKVVPTPDLNRGLEVQRCSPAKPRSPTAENDLVGRKVCSELASHPHTRVITSFHVLMSSVAQAPLECDVTTTQCCILCREGLHCESNGPHPTSDGGRPQHHRERKEPGRS